MRVRGRELPCRPPRPRTAGSIHGSASRGPRSAGSSGAPGTPAPRRNVGSRACTRRGRLGSSVHQMKLGQGRIVKAETLAGSAPVALPVEQKTLPRGHLVHRVVLEAAERAQALIAAAEARAARL